MSYTHVPVMPVEVKKYLNCRPGEIIVDCTLGGAGHAKEIVERIIPDGLLIGIDQDSDAIENAKEVLAPFQSNICLFHDNFVNLSKILSQLNIPKIDGVLLDLGLSFHQIEKSGRGFSFRKDEPLDMRMDKRSKMKAENLVNTANEKDLADILFKFGEEKQARQIAKSIVEARKKSQIQTTEGLVEIVTRAISRKNAAKYKIHPATRTFMALRIAVNSELEKLSVFMDGISNLLNRGGRLCVLSFHSLEDRIVKQKIRYMEKRCTCPSDFPKCVCNKEVVFRTLTKKALRPTPNEISANPMARSAKLRAAERV